VLRTPLLPVDILPRIQAMRAVDDARSLSPWVEPAILVASRSTYDAMQKGLASPRLLRTLGRYLRRMASRPTPFGLFAAVTTVPFGDSSTVRLQQIPARTRSRADTGWLFDQALTLQERPEVLRDLRVQANPLAVRRGDRLFLDTPAYPCEREPCRPRSIRATSAVLKVMQAARQPIPYRALVDALTNTPAQKVEDFIAALVRETFLLTDLRPPLTNASPIAYIADRLAMVPAACDDHRRLGAIIAQTDRYDTAGADQRVEAYQALTSLGAPDNGRASREPPLKLHVDAVAATNGGTLNRAVADDAALCAELLLRLNPWQSSGPRLFAYRNAFEARYGTGREVPLRDCVDPDRGIGPMEEVAPEERSVAAQELLVLLVTTATQRGHHEILLSDAQLGVLEGTAERLVFPSSLDIIVSVAARSRAAIDAGDYLVAVAPAAGASPGGRATGRFADLVEPAWDAVLTAKPRAGLTVDLTFAPRLARQANVVIRPPSSPYEIAIDVPSVAASPIPVDEIVIGLASHGLYARWIADERPLDLVPHHMLNFREGPPAARVLAEIAVGSHAQIAPFYWGNLERLPFLPRLRYGRCVISPAVWRLTTERWAQYRAEFGAASLDRWRHDWRVPSTVMRSVGDMCLYTSFDDPQTTDEIDELLKKPGWSALRLHEYLPGNDETWLEGPAGRHAAELTVSLINRAWSPPADLVLSGGLTPSLPDLRHVGSDWLYLKLYVLPSLVEDILGTDVQRLVADLLQDRAVESWFFVRYADPDPHLRLRFRGHPGVLLGAVVPALCVWARGLVDRGKATRFAFESYDREVDRYGGAASLDLIEEIFRIDSEAALQILALRDERERHFDPHAIETLSVYALIDHLHVRGAQRAELFASWKAHRHASGALHRSCARDLYDLGRAYHDEDPNRAEATAVMAVLHERGNRMRPLAAQLAVLCDAETRRAEIIRSAIHMHCNRLLGSARQQEAETYGLVWRLSSWLASRSPHAV
jgi:thiopeptide-type bacteriocin biosynthesis protein